MVAGPSDEFFLIDHQKWCPPIPEEDEEPEKEQKKKKSRKKAA